MEALANMMVAAVDLAEAEGHQLRVQFVRTLIVIGVLILGLLTALAGVGFFVYGVFSALALYMPAPAAAVLLGTVLIALAAGAVWMARNMVK